MARRDSRSRGGGRGGRGGRGGYRRRKKFCRICADPRNNIIDYKNLNLLKQFVDEEGTIRKGRQTGTCRKHQSHIAQAIKRARTMALVPYIPEH